MRSADLAQTHTAVTPHVVVVGGGFGGLYAARALAKHPVRVTLVDRHNHHLFQPLLYQVATAALSPGEIAEPIRTILRRYPNIRVLLGEVTGIDLARREVQLASIDGSPAERLAYDYLVLACGARHAYFGHDDWEPLAPGLKTLEDALEIRRRILLALEAAERETDPARREAYVNFVIVGGGPTGVELAGAIAEIARHTVVHDFRSIDPRRARVVLLEGGPRVLASYPPGLSASAERQLRGLGVDVRTGAVAVEVTPEAVRLHDGSVIPTRTTLWAAGVAASPLGRTLGVPTDRSGRVRVEADLTLPGHPEVYVVGDMALFDHTRDHTPLPGLAPVAIQQGQHAALNIARSAQGLPRRPFRYWNRGSLATIGRAAGVAEIGPLRFGGLLAWLAWLFVHIFFLIGFENRALVMLQWAWSYFTYERGARLITGPWQPEVNRASQADGAALPGGTRPTTLKARVREET